MELKQLFSELSDQTSKEINLNTEAKEYLTQLSVIDTNGNWLKENPLIVSNECEKLITHVHDKYNISFSYGGYCEDRSILWHNTYLDEAKTWTHLGIDINILAGTTLVSPITGKVIVSDHDSDHPNAPQNHGWGNRLIIHPDNNEHALIFAHLSVNSRRKVGDIIESGEILGTIGTSRENGGWFEHFHIQSVSIDHLNRLIETGKIDTLDGYASLNDPKISVLYPNPFTTF